ncbi:hypothetical protein WNZ14_14570 [Hoeflea sp. AS60]|uniref:hypothetical protein n=1 Tax=Hoeflea sp. AS60 TaxID=3135780 RepID=UPI00317AAD61
MKTALLLVSGALIFGVTFAGWYWLNAFGCGMNTTGCSGFSLNWEDWEALQLFVPTFVLGLALMIAGGWRLLARYRS